MDFYVLCVLNDLYKLISDDKIIFAWIETCCVDEMTSKLQDFCFELVDGMPVFLSKAADEYKEFTTTLTSNDVKSFVAYQAACRTALTHLQLLIKIAAWAEQAMGDGIVSEDDSDIDQLILEARAAIQSNKIHKY